MRSADWINLLAFSFLTVMAWARRIPGRRRANATILGAIGLITIVLGARLASRIVSDWLPCVLLLFVYWQAGQFFLGPNEELQERFVRIDRQVVSPILEKCTRHRAGRWLLEYLEFAYLFCYPMVPLAVGALYGLHRVGKTGEFWVVVLAATYPCYLLVPFLPLLPPRTVSGPVAEGPPRSGVRTFNLWILRNGSIHANTFPSAHVAASCACALYLLTVAPVVGWIFAVIAVSIALGAVSGRYHYALDAAAGAALAAIAYFVWRRMLL